MEISDQASHMKALSDGVLRKVGRNMVLFQMIENLLKILVANQRVDGTATNIVKRQQKRAKVVQKKTMGYLIERLLSEAGEPPKEPQDVSQVWISTTFTISGDGDFDELLRAGLELMLSERNDLTHHFLPRWKPDSLEHMTEAASYLDQQHEKTVPMFEHLKSITISMQNSRKEMAAFLVSNEGVRQFKLTWLQHNPLVTLLQEVATLMARPDGWTYLTHAEQHAIIHESDEVAHMKERYEFSTLEQLLIASELFDVLDEPFPNGNSHTLYRAKKTLKH